MSTRARCKIKHRQVHLVMNALHPSSSLHSRTIEWLTRAFIRTTYETPLEHATTEMKGRLYTSNLPQALRAFWSLIREAVSTLTVTQWTMLLAYAREAAAVSRKLFVRIKILKRPCTMLWIPGSRTPSIVREGGDGYEGGLLNFTQWRISRWWSFTKHNQLCNCGVSNDGFIHWGYIFRTEQRSGCPTSTGQSTIGLWKRFRESRHLRICLFKMVL